MTNSLDLGDEEFDPVELQMEIESAFGFGLSDDEASSVRTMGDLHDLLMNRIATTSGERCLTTMAFLRLRRAMAPLASDMRLRPDTPLTEIPAKSPKALFDALRLENGLRLPPLASGWPTLISGILFLSLFVIVPVMLAFKVSWLIATGVIAAVVLLMWPLQRIDPMRFPKGFETVGDLARAVAAYNASVLANQGGKLDRDSVWQALVQLVIPFALTSKSDIDRETTILRTKSA